MDVNNPRNKIEENAEDVEAVDILVKNILLAIEKGKGKLKFDRTYRSAIKEITPKGVNAP